MSTVYPASEKQVTFLTRLLSEKAISDETRAKIGDPSTLEGKTASKVIDWLLKQPGAAGAEAMVKANIAALDVGMYAKEGEIYRVKRSKSSGNLYAVILRGSFFDYAPGALRTLAPEDRMTLEQAKAYGQQTGICCVCAAVLTDPKSIAAGIGPICGKRV